MVRRSFLGLALAAALLVPARALGSNCNGTQTGLVPLTTLALGTYHGYAGGLYPGGSNARPPAHDAAGLAIANAVAPLDTFGNADPNGKIVLISIGMSNTTQEFSTFVPMANADPMRNPKVMAIDCAQGGQSADVIKDPNAPYWATVNSRLRAAGSSPLQAQVAWVKEADPRPTSGFPAATLTLMRELGTIMRILHDKYPNIRIAYLSSRIYAGYATTNLNPEPYAYESGFAVKWLIEGQIAGEDTLNYDAGQGVVEAPWLAWGPYLWADGLNPREGDGLIWECSDFQTSDGTHPATGARIKVSEMLLDLLHTDGTAQPWYVASTVAAPVPAVPAIQLALAPNPAHGPVEMTFASSVGQPWRLEVVDLAGRRVRELGTGFGDGALQSHRWDARDAAGGRARAGVYWVRLVSAGRETVRRLVLLTVP